MTEVSVSEFVEHRPAPPLRPLVARYTGYRQVGLAPGRHRGLPSPYLTLIFTLDEPLEVAAHPDPRTPPGRYATLVGGLHTAPALITHPGRQSGIQLALSPLGARALLGLPAGELAGLDVDAAEVFGASGRELHERLLAAGGWPERFALLDRFLAPRAAAATPPRPEVAHAWRRLLAGGGAAPVAELAREVGWSPRYLGRRFDVEIGLSPKAVARVVRFDRARRRLQRRAGTGPDLALADLAAGCGYYDQAHLAREFRSLAGCPPSRWLWEEFRYVQAGPAPALPDSGP
ncbi:helix-turn-helix domain-containing protein [Micromonospora sp. NPDC049559]|uniref:helix-turn-helix domain-containing protein n=1 Tax=Micromonospora sp. NPDC049559 TaxID=3155923 RepID=UPI00342C248F